MPSLVAIGLKIKYQFNMSKKNFEILQTVILKVKKEAKVTSLPSYLYSLSSNSQKRTDPSIVTFECRVSTL